MNKLLVFLLMLAMKLASESLSQDNLLGCLFEEMEPLWLDKVPLFLLLLLLFFLNLLLLSLVPLLFPLFS
jgi:hypothetical protein